MNHRILFLPADPASAATLLDVDGDGRVLARAQLQPGTPAPVAPAAASTVLVVPGTAVRIDRLDLPAHSAAQARAAARALLAARLARADALHVALDSAQAGPLRTVAAVEAALMRGWLDRAAAFGLAIDAAVPEQLLLPVPDASGAAHVLDAGDRWLVRADAMAFAAEPALAAQVLGERERVVLDGDLVRFAARALRPDIDLLQGEFVPAWKRTRPAGRRRLAWLTAALAISPLLLVAAQALQLTLAARSLEARVSAVVRDALPVPGTAPSGGVDTLDAQLQAAREPRAFAAATGALFSAVAARPGVRLVDLEYQRGDRLRATIAHPGADDLDALRGALAAEGWRLVEGGSRDADGGLRTAVSLEPDA
ncbi:type II secretion system protein GspL [Luteimonas kalidii]|uniref:Type II secretion system protein GspL n=1 Tax=Luteimonas kalidii TaxID=3042025 RepID=A0ABT6JQW1_9GAMM|nr:type II secretion system protein GspL [Luteimonas kalidii]MDH5832873.1 type II secretion system protein GspL [Luteimonas kalidii]